MNSGLVLESIRLALGKILFLIDPAAKADEPIDALYARYNDAVQRQSKAVIGSKLGISADSVRKLITDPLNFALSAAKQSDGTLAAITCLRCLFLLEPILQRKLSCDAPLLIDEQTDVGQARKQVRAVELILRAMIREKHVDEDRLLERLRVLFANAPKDINRWLKDADPGDVLSGMLLRDLSAVFTHAEEWNLYEALYDRVKILEVASDRRNTIETYLADVNSIRNCVAHHKNLTRVQIELLNVYYAELVEPIQRLFRAGRTGVNPEAIATVDKSTVDRYLDLLREDLDRVGVETGETGRRTKWIVGLTALILMVVVGGFALQYFLNRAGRQARAMEYQSLGWVAASAAGGNVQARIFLGNAATDFGHVSLLAAMRMQNSTERALDLSQKVTIVQRGAQEPVSFSVPAETKAVTFCLIVPSAELESKYRVTQTWNFTEDDLIPASARIVTREDGLACKAK